MKNQRAIGCSIITIILVVLIIMRIINASQQAQFKSEHPNPTTTLDCASCSQGIPMYDSWSSSRTIVAYGHNGDQCEVSSYYTTTYSLTLQPRAAYTFIDMLPHLYLNCPTGSGFVYTSQTTFVAP